MFSFISWRSFRLFLFSGYYQYSGNEHGWTSIFGVAIESFGHIPRSCMAGYMVDLFIYFKSFTDLCILFILIFLFWELFCSFMSLQSHWQWMKLPFVTHSLQHVSCLFDLGHSGVRWGFREVFICISQIAKDAEYYEIFLNHVYFSFWDPLPIFQMGLLKIIILCFLSSLSILDIDPLSET